jgi:hypothetical protein
MSASLRPLLTLFRGSSGAPSGFTAMTVDDRPSHFSFNISQHFKSDDKGCSSYSFSYSTYIASNLFSDAVALRQGFIIPGEKENTGPQSVPKLHQQLQTSYSTMHSLYGTKARSSMTTETKQQTPSFYKVNYLFRSTVKWIAFLTALRTAGTRRQVVPNHEW